MKILHVCLAAFYIDNYSYQENILPQIHKSDGNEVKIIASTETFKEGVELEFTQKGRYLTKEGIEVVRLSYTKGIPLNIARKIRFYDGTYDEISNFSPDIIFIHGLQFGDIKQIIKYKKRNIQVRIFADSHSDKYNSASSNISKFLLHRVYYKYLIHKVLPYLKKIFFITIETKLFLEEMYNIPQNKMEYYPLGGIIVNNKEIKKIRYETREKLELDDNDILFIHSGKMNKLKKTKELIEAFSKINEKNCFLLIIGRFDKSYEKEVVPLIAKDDRILFLGWKTGDELRKYLCAGDVYVQPGTQSATMQNALCCGCAVILADYPSHRYLLGDKAIYADDKNSLYREMNKMIKFPETMHKIQDECYSIAKEKLDYYKLARRIYY